ncbi:hypothetical protein K503DRAFT_416350 [Rhizopogon vinicolor AM-OR11-026]|uniref:Uncharacterized protein n=1 Tax=Rhizopogon vinicolor AM-OR11-026 TaxID=1314800 RepID=A0A1B7NBA7_9AGAM|nr:hypothetical protein K503DRAFT_416350 [Rhizopogon vinicolor AM-OR11-026]
MKKFMTDLALKPKFLEEYKLNPTAIVESAEGLSNLEKFGLKFARDIVVYTLMKATEFDIASGRQLTEEEIAKGNGGLQGALTIVIALFVIVVRSSLRSPDP